MNKLQERDSIQQVLAAYEGDMTSAPNQMQQLQQRRIEAAEKSASEMREMVKKLELELHQIRGGAVMSRGLEALQEKLQVILTSKILFCIFAIWIKVAIYFQN